MKHLRWQEIFKRTIFVGVCVAVLALCGYALPTPQYTLEPGTPHLKETREQFVRDIKELGGVQAYARFSNAVRGLGIDDQHGYAHTFGHELYTIEGERGIVACDANFGLGCFHQFLGDAIADLGTTSVARLYNACAAVTGTVDVCQHGLGHGVLAGIGYEERDLESALTLCSSVTSEHGYSGCEGGVFMEYNMRTIAIAEGTVAARTADADLYAPCDSVRSESRKNCVFWLPEWWLFIVFNYDRQHASNNETFARMGRMCAASPYPQTCYEGIGYVTPTAFSFNAQDVRAACDSVGAKGVVYCRGMAALIFHLTEATRAHPEVLCEDLPPTEQGMCMQYAAHDSNFSFTVPEMP